MKKIILTSITVAMGLFGLFLTTHAQSVPAIPPIAILPQTLSDGVVGSPYVEDLTASTTALGPFTWTVFAGSLPPGLSLDPISGGSAAILSGNPNTGGQYNFTLDATNGTTATTQSYTLNIDTSTMPLSTTSSTATTTITTTTVTPAGITTTTTVTSSTIEAQLENAELELSELETALAQTTGGSAGETTPVTAGVVFDRDLTIGSVGADVTALQQFLNQNGYPVAQSGPGSAGNETDYFGTLTQAALAQWQAANGVSPAQGYYGPITRSKIMLSASAASSAPMIPAPTSTSSANY